MSKRRESKLFHPIGVSAEDIRVLNTPKAYAQQLLTLISNAKSRIFITALYLQDDEAGRDILHAIYQAKGKNPSLEVNIFVDLHRAQRGLIGEKDSLGNRAFYLEIAKQYDTNINIFGVGVKSKELLGVLHLKGMVFDDTVLYTGASINNIYLHYQGKYRLDRYYQIESAKIADNFCQFQQTYFINSDLCPRLNTPDIPSKNTQKLKTSALKSLLKTASYQGCTAVDNTHADISITPYVGFGARKNRLNNTIRKVVKNSTSSLVIFTPYFNLPKPLLKDLLAALKRNVKVTLVIGDKKANDFYIADDNDFSTIGIVPYLYEMLLVRFLKHYQRFIDNGQLDVKLWQDNSNSFHLKGVMADQKYHVITGSNLNPRAWALDLENGLLLEDPKKLLADVFNEELTQVLKNTWSVKHYGQLDRISDHPDKPRKLLNKIRLSKVDRILKRFL